MNENTRWAVRILEGAEREILEEMRGSSTHDSVQSLWEGMNHCHRAILFLVLGEGEVGTWKKESFSSRRLGAALRRSTASGGNGSRGSLLAFSS